MPGNSGSAGNPGNPGNAGGPGIPGIPGISGIPEVSDSRGERGNAEGGGFPGLLVAGRYRLAESIGQGGMGRVWRAADEVLDRRVAVKEMRIDGPDSEDTRTRRERTLREARATARIDHPHVVRVYDVVDEGRRLWIVMELVAGRSLEQLMAEEGPLDPREAARIGLGLVRALRQVHARGVLHRDIKPGNVLVEGRGDAHAPGSAEFAGGPQGREGGDGRVVLTDFGIAAIQDATALTMVGMLVGSPDYMAPERISGHPQGPPSDVWSLGATLCAALAGRSPFSRDTTLATLHAVLYEEPRLPVNAGPLQPVLAALLHKDPTVRPTLAALESTLASLALPPPPQAPTPTPTPTLAVGPRAARPPATGAPEGRDTTAGAQAGATERVQDERAPYERAADEPASDAPSSDERTSDEPASDERTTDQRGADDRAADEHLPGGADVASGARRSSPPRVFSEEASEMRAESGSEPPPAGPSGLPPPHPGVSPTRSRAVTQRRPAPDARTVPDAHTVPDPRAVPETPARPAAPVGTRVRRGDTVRAPDGPPATVARRRTGAVVATAAALAAAGAVVAVVLATPPGGHDGDDRTGGSSSRPPAVASTDARTGTGTGATATGGPAAGASASPTVEGTSRPPSLPPGAHQEAGGFAWVTPKGWRRDVKTGAEVHYTSPDGTQELVAKSSLAQGDLMDTWRTSEENARQGRDYRKIRLEETTFRGRPAVVWEYTFSLGGTPWHARLLGFDEDGKSYQINTWYRPATEESALRTYEKVKAGFTVM